jgi:hypothetical protein
MGDGSTGTKAMSTQAQEINLIVKLRGNLTLGKRMLADPHFETRHVRLFRIRAKDSLTKIYGADSELVQELNSAADAAVLVSDPKVGLQRIVLFVARILSSLTNDVMLGREILKKH